jgi:hypothetical protein
MLSQTIFINKFSYTEVRSYTVWHESKGSWGLTKGSPLRGLAPLTCAKHGCMVMSYTGLYQQTPIQYKVLRDDGIRTASYTAASLQVS